MPTQAFSHIIHHRTVGCCANTFNFKKFWELLEEVTFGFCPPICCNNLWYFMKRNPTFNQSFSYSFNWGVLYLHCCRPPLESIEAGKRIAVAVQNWQWSHDIYKSSLGVRERTYCRTSMTMDFDFWHFMHACVHSRIYRIVISHRKRSLINLTLAFIPGWDMLCLIPNTFCHNSFEINGRVGFLACHILLLH